MSPPGELLARPRPLAERRVPELGVDHCFVDGRFEAGDGERLTVTFPVTAEVLAEIGLASPRQAERAVAAARRAFDHGPWRRWGAGRRAEVLNAMADHLEGRLDELVELVMLDNGKTREEARVDVLAAVAACRRSAEHAVTDREERPAVERGVEKWVVREPVGVVLALTPFNAPLMFAGLKAAPALAAGNSVVLKPSERAPLLARALCQAAVAAGLPDGVLNLVHGRGDLASRLAEHPDVDMITLTGGNRAGTAVMAAAAPTVKNLLLELGGKSAHIVLADADLARAVPAVVAGIFRNAGQRCFSGSRLVVAASVADEVERRVCDLAESLRLGDPFEPGTEIGPLIDGRALAAVDEFVDRCLAEGDRLGAGGRRQDELGAGAFYRPTVLLGAAAGGRSAQEEVFGPVLTVIRVADADEAVRVANHSRYGLAGAVWSEDLERAMAVARAVRSGYFWVNTYSAIFGDVPFGGFGHSGLGREAGRWGYRAYTELKSILVDTTGGTSAPLFRERS